MSLQIIGQVVSCTSNPELAGLLTEIENQSEGFSDDDFDLIIKSIAPWADTATVSMLMHCLPAKAFGSLYSSLLNKISTLIHLMNKFAFDYGDKAVTPDLAIAFRTMERLGNFVNGAWTGPKKHVIHDWAILIMIVDDESFQAILPHFTSFNGQANHPAEAINATQLVDLRLSLQALHKSLV